MYIKNPVLQFLFSLLDFPIRFIYVRLPGFLRKIFFRQLYETNFDNLEWKYNQISTQLDKLEFSLRGKNCLELGPGNSYYIAYRFLLQGADKVILIDKFPRYFNTRRQRAYYDHEIEHFKEKYGADGLKVIGQESERSGAIQMYIGDIVEMEISEEVDFVYSHHVLEHVKDVPGTLASLFEIMKPGAVAYHVIDLRDHFNFNSPFLFYKYSSHTWENLLTKEGKSFTNRLRVDELIHAFEQAGYEILDLETKKFKLDVPRMADIFADKDEEVLSTGRASFLVRK